MKKLLLGLSMILGLGLMAPIATNISVHAQTKADICKGIEATGAKCNPADDKDKAENKVNKLIAQIINILSWVVGVVAVIFVIWGGFKYITSGGDSNKVGSAKNTIVYALIGLVIVALAQAIVIFVLNSAT